MITQVINKVTNAINTVRGMDATEITVMLMFAICVLILSMLADYVSIHRESLSYYKGNGTMAGYGSYLEAKREKEYEMHEELRKEYNIKYVNTRTARKNSLRDKLMTKSNKDFDKIWNELDKAK